MYVGVFCFILNFSYWCPLYNSFPVICSIRTENIQFHKVFFLNYFGFLFTLHLCNRKNKAKEDTSVYPYYVDIWNEFLLEFQFFVSLYGIINWQGTTFTVILFYWEFFTLTFWLCPRWKKKICHSVLPTVKACLFPFHITRILKLWFLHSSDSSVNCSA